MGGWLREGEKGRGEKKKKGCEDEMGSQRWSEAEKRGERNPTGI